MRRWWQQLAAFSGLAWIYVTPVNAQTWDGILQTVRKRFPAVRQISPKELAAWLGDTNRPVRPLLIDVREPREFAVSHLAGARNLRSAAQVEEIVASKAAPIVVYCSVGYRSSALAEKLRKAGLTNIFNLEGSIFAWANEGRPLYRGSQVVDPPKVHPYDAKWGQLLRPELRAGPEESGRRR